MLSELILENFILVEKAALSFGRGLTVITGATGAGKSLFIKALKLVLGGRADTSVLRPGSKQASVQALFEIPEEIRQILLLHGIETDDSLIVRRIIPAEGKGRIFINGVLSTLQQLRKITGPLVTIAGQHEFQNLLKREKHLGMLDEFGNLQNECSGLAELHRKSSVIRAGLDKLRDEYGRSREEKGRIRLEQELIDKIDPREHEEEELEQERTILKASSRLRELGEEIYQKLYAARGSITEELSLCRASMEKMSGIDPSLIPLRDLLDSITYQADDLAISLRDYIQKLPLDISRLEKIEERLFQLQKLRKRFGPDIASVLSYRKELEKEIARFDKLEGEIASLSGRLQEADKKLCRKAALLTRKRKMICGKMEQAVLKELSALNLPNASFRVNIISPSDIRPEDVTPSGADQVEFLFSANPGQPLRPLAKVASGGELSRILLAIKIITGKRDLEETLVFDEIDAGLGGEVAENVGRKLKKMGRSHQVIVITHFPQIAAMGQRHLVVEKRERTAETITEVRHLSGSDRLDEIVRMLGGETDTARKYARELLGPVLRRT